MNLERISRFNFLGAKKQLNTYLSISRRSRDIAFCLSTRLFVYRNPLFAFKKIKVNTYLQILNDLNLHFLNNLKSNFQCYFFCFQYIILNRTISPTSIPSYGIDVFFFQYTLITRDCFLTFFTNMYISRLHQDSFIVNQLLCCYHPHFL